MRLLYEFVRALRGTVLAILNSLSTLFYRITCRSFGVGSRVKWGTWISKPHQVEVGRNVVIGRRVNIGCETAGSTLVLGNDVQINDDVLLDYTGGVSVGTGTLISSGTIIYSHAHHGSPKANPTPYGKNIGERCWIGARSVILEGCRRIGDDVTVGAMSVVTRDLTSPGTYGGSPAKPLSK